MRKSRLQYFQDQPEYIQIPNNIHTVGLPSKSTSSEKDLSAAFSFHKNITYVPGLNDFLL